MLRTAFALMILVSVCLPIGLIYAQQSSPSAVKDEMEKAIKNTDKELKGEIKRLEYDLKAVQRDQMNYRIEKDALKEIYSSNIQTINMAIALALFAIAVCGTFVGFIGFRNIAKVKEDYSKEFKTLKKKKKELDRKLREVTEEYERTKKRNEIQDRRIGELEYVLEIQRLADHYPARALGFAISGVHRYPDSAMIWSRKGRLHVVLNQYEEAIEAFARAVEIHPDNEFVVGDLLETCLMVGQVDQCESVLNRCANVIREIDQEQNNLFLPYIDLLKSYQIKDLKTMKTIIKEALLKFRDQPRSQMMRWSFDDATEFLDHKPASEEKKLLELFIKVMTGQKAPTDLLKEVGE